jgi:hypothetical protein
VVTWGILALPELRHPPSTHEEAGKGPKSGQRSSKPQQLAALALVVATLSIDLFRKTAESFGLSRIPFEFLD